MEDSERTTDHYEQRSTLFHDAGWGPNSDDDAGDAGVRGAKGSGKSTGGKTGGKVTGKGRGKGNPNSDPPNLPKPKPKTPKPKTPNQIARNVS